MADRREPSSRLSRQPLGDATARVNNTSSKKPPKHHEVQTQQPDSLRAHPTDQNAYRYPNASKNATTKLKDRRGHPDQRESVVSHDDHEYNKRDSQMSALSTVSFSKRRKTQVGPWQLGKTLGAGSAARVRLVRHNVTHELAAVKILCKETGSGTYPGSIADLDRWDRTREEYRAGNRIPMAIEREIAIMKLIDHPNIVRLFDIWENRSEIYLVIEYVEHGDLYTYMATKGRLSEAETMFYFRQILDGLDYVHSFNICHRDLKPENILLGDNGQIKITDFGMSAIHQNVSNTLKTSCGSPHYASPELVKQIPYRGDLADIWSLGVILYGCLTNTLPFMDPDIQRVLKKVEIGKYRIPNYVSPMAQDLIRGILESDPEERLNSAEIWDHPFVRKFDYLDDLNNGDGAHDYKQNARRDPVPVDEVDKQTLRQLKSVWHSYSEMQIARNLTNNERNDFKLFYWLLYSYRERTLENYGNELTYSASDYHHLQPANWKKKYTTLDFPAKYGRTGSRFTVISNVATDENGEVLERTSTDGGATIASYDPYKSSRVMKDVVASQAKITIHRNGTTSTRHSSTRNSRPPSVLSTSARTNSTNSRRPGAARNVKAPSTLRSSRRSMNSIKSGEIAYKRPISRRHKRGVDFSHANLRLAGQGEAGCRPASIAGDDTTFDRDHTYATSPTKRSKLSKRSGRKRAGTQSMADVSQDEDGVLHWNEELRHFSRSIAKDCDDAFNSTLLSTESLFPDSPISEHTRLSMSAEPQTPTPATRGTRQSDVNVQILCSSPQAPAPPPKDSDVHEHPRPIDNMVSQLNRVSQASGLSNKTEADRRHVSAPIYLQYGTQWGKDKIPLPSINETKKEYDYSREEDKYRTVSAPAAEPSAARFTPAKADAGLESLAQQRDTIRLVDINSPLNQPGRIAAQVTASVHPESALGATSNPQPRRGPTLRQQYQDGERQSSTSNQPIAPVRDGSDTTIKKKKSWFKRGSKERDEILDNPSVGNTEDFNRTDTNSSNMPPAKKKSFGFSFWRSSKDEPQMKLSLGGPDVDEPPSPEPPRMFSHPSRPPYNKKWNDKAATRNIEPQQNWLARLFRVKPATKYLCFTISRRRVRQEVASMLKEWRRHGMRDIVVDKERNLVFARVAKKNSLGVKEATFAAEIMTVIEHGRRNPLCIVRFTQERGSASTFHKVVDAMADIFGSRGLLVVDKHKTKMMIKTLTS